MDWIGLDWGEGRGGGLHIKNEKVLVSLKYNKHDKYKINIIKQKSRQNIRRDFFFLLFDTQLDNMDNTFPSNSHAPVDFNINPNSFDPYAFDIEVAKFLLNFSAYSRIITLRGRKDVNDNDNDKVKLETALDVNYMKGNAVFLDMSNLLVGNDKERYVIYPNGNDAKVPYVWNNLAIEWSDYTPEGILTKTGSSLMQGFLSIAGSAGEILVNMLSSVLTTIKSILKGIIRGLGYMPIPRFIISFVTKIGEWVRWLTISMTVYATKRFVDPQGTKMSDPGWAAAKEHALSGETYDVGRSNGFLFEKKIDENGSADSGFHEFFMCFRESAGQELFGVIPLANLSDFWISSEQTNFLMPPDISKTGEYGEDDPLAWHRPFGAILVHKNIHDIYFYPLYKRLIEKIRVRVKEIKKSYIGNKDDLKFKFSLSGFSLGGALSTMMALAIKLEIPEADIQIYTFGCPRIGNRSFVHLFNTLIPNAHRVIKETDLITAYPSMYQNLNITEEARKRTKKALSDMNKAINILNVEELKTKDVEHENGSMIGMLPREVATDASYVQQFWNYMKIDPYEDPSGAEDPIEIEKRKKSMEDELIMMNLERKRINYGYVDYCHTGGSVTLYDSGCYKIRPSASDFSSDISRESILMTIKSAIANIPGKISAVFAKNAEYKAMIGDTIGEYAYEAAKVGKAGTWKAVIKFLKKKIELVGLILMDLCETYTAIAITNKIYSKRRVLDKEEFAKRTATRVARASGYHNTKRLEEIIGHIFSLEGVMTAVASLYGTVKFSMLSGASVTVAVSAALSSGLGIAIIIALGWLVGVFLKKYADHLWESAQHGLSRLMENHGRPMYRAILQQSCDYLNEQQKAIDLVLSLGLFDLDPNQIDGVYQACKRSKDATCMTTPMPRYSARKRVRVEKGRNDKPVSRSHVKMGNNADIHHGCNKCKKIGIVEDMILCPSCEKVYYCSRHCQIQDWIGGHANQCRLLQIEPTP